MPEDAKASKLSGYVFVVRGRKEYALTAGSAAERDAWLTALRNNSKCAPLDGLDVAEVDCAGKKKKQGMMMRAENFVAKKALTS